MEAATSRAINGPGCVSRYHVSAAGVGLCVFRDRVGRFLAARDELVGGPELTGDATAEGAGTGRFRSLGQRITPLSAKVPAVHEVPKRQFVEVPADQEREVGFTTPLLGCRRLLRRCAKVCSNRGATQN